MEETDDGNSEEDTSILLPEIDSLCNRVKELTKTVNFLSSQYDKQREENKKLKSDMISLKKELQMVKDNYEKKERNIDEIQKKLSVQEQYERNKNVEIAGVKKTEKEDLKAVMTKLAKKMKIPDFSENQIDKIHRVPHRNKSSRREENVIVQFKTRTDRDKWIERRKESVTNDDVMDKGGKSRIYVNEHLAPLQKYLLWKTRQRAKEKNWKYTWVKEGKIFCRKEEKEKCYQIRSEEEILQVISDEEEYRDIEEV